MTLKAQLAQVATLVPIDLVLVGKTCVVTLDPEQRKQQWPRHTSEANTQLTGPKLREKNILVKNIIATPACR